MSLPRSECLNLDETLCSRASGRTTEPSDYSSSGLTPYDSTPNPAIQKLRIGVSGNIGAGKTTFTKSLSDVLCAFVHGEPDEQSKYLSLFYKDKKKYAYQLQVEFLHMRHNQYKKEAEGARIVAYDRTIFEDYVFAENSHDQGLISDHDFEEYKLVYRKFCDAVELPSFMIYLYTSPDVLMTRVLKRNRQCEMDSDGISFEYLSSLNSAYDRFVVEFSKKTPVFRVDWNKFGDTFSVINKIWTKVTQGQVENGVHEIEP